MSKDIDSLLKEKYDEIQIPDYIFNVNFKAFRQRILWTRITFVVLIISIVLTISMLFIQNNLQKNIDNLSEITLNTKI